MIAIVSFLMTTVILRRTTMSILYPTKGFSRKLEMVNSVVRGGSVPVWRITRFRLSQRHPTLRYHVCS
uniref:Secreted protein n=1 Tax=Parascaris equorum TaxID=6256 RepID=A0A914RLA3_PAREQ